MKICKRCKIEKELDCFNKHNGIKDGHVSFCKKCTNERKRKNYNNNKVNESLRHKKYYEKNKEEILIKHREYYDNNKIKESLRHKKYYKENKEKILITNNKYYKENKEEILIKRKEYYVIDENKSKKKEYNDRYYLENSERIIKRNIEYNNSHPHIILQHTMISRVLKYKNDINKIKYEDKLGYTSDKLKIHIETLFEDCMTWNNWGEWHIDHIIPISMFKLDTPVSIINSLNNLRPVPKEYNLSKGNKLDEAGYSIIDEYIEFLFDYKCTRLSFNNSFTISV